MKNKTFFLIAFSAMLFIVISCKKPDKERLIGDWKATYAVKSTGDTLVYEHENYKLDLALGFTENQISWEQKETISDSSNVTITKTFGNYSWNNDILDVTLFYTGNKAEGTADVSFPSDDDLNMKFTLTDNTGKYSIDVKAVRQ